MPRDLALKIVAEHHRRRSRRARLDLARLTFGPQRSFVTDTAPFVAASCSRQAGKSYGIGIKLIDTAADYPGKTCLYITNTRPQARAIMWPVLHEIDRELELGGKFHEVRLTYTLPNGGVVQLGGANDEIEIERYRGPQYPVVVIDEAQSIRPFIRYLIFEVIRPGQAKYGSAGQIFVTGTPNASRHGFLYDVTTGSEEGWSLHHWTIRDNPHIPDVEAFIADQLKRRGLTETDAAYLREYCGEWVRDAASQVYQVKARNLLDAFPDQPGDWEYVLGVDLGPVNVTAFVVLAYSVKAGQIVTAESFQVTPPAGESMLTPEHLADLVQGIRGRYSVVSTVIDPGGLGAKYIEELRRRFSIPCIAAEKTRKLGAIELMNGDLRTGKLLVVEDTNRDLLHDAAALEWDWRKVDQTRHGGNVQRSDLVIDDRNPDHLTDAWTYGYRECRHFLYADGDAAPRPRYGSAEYDEWEEERRFEEEIEGAGDDWLDDDAPDADPLGLSGFGV